MKNRKHMPVPDEDFRRSIEQRIQSCEPGVIDLSRSNIDPHSIGWVINQLELLDGITTLYIGSNPIGDVGIAMLADSKSMSRTRELYVHNNDIGNLGIEALSKSRHFSNICTLDISNNRRIAGEGFRMLAASRRLPSLRTLNISENWGVDVETLNILGASKRLEHLHSLDLQHCSLVPESAKVLAASKRLVSLRNLNLGGNSIGDDGASALAGPRCLLNLHSLEVDSNDICDPAVIIALCDKMLSCRHVGDGGGNAEVALRVNVAGNPLSWGGPGGEIPQRILTITDPLHVKSRLEEVRNVADRTRLLVGRVVMSGPTEHGKTHLAKWLTADTEEKKQAWSKPLFRSSWDDGTWGADRLSARLRRSEHEIYDLPDFDLRIIDCGGHPQQLQSHHNLYFASWERSVFVLCVRADRDFEESWGNYHLGLIADLKAISIGWRRGVSIGVRELLEESGKANAYRNSELMKLPVVLVATHADKVKNKSERRLRFPTPKELARNHPLINAVAIEAWDAIAGWDIQEIKRAIARQLNTLPELRTALPKYIRPIILEIERCFGRSNDRGMSRQNSMSFLEFKVMCERVDVFDTTGEHIYALQALDDLGYVVAPGCHEHDLSPSQIVLNPQFVQNILYRKLLNPSPRPRGGILLTKVYRELFHDLSEADRATLESMMKLCLVAFEVRGRGDQPLGWLIPDLLMAAETWQEWPEESCSAHLSSEDFLNESVFFEFARDVQKLIERSIVGDVVSLSLHRDGCVLERGESRARVRCDVRKRTIHIEVCGGNPDDAERWCWQILTWFERATGAKGMIKSPAGIQVPFKRHDHELREKIFHLVDQAGEEGVSSSHMADLIRNAIKNNPALGLKLNASEDIHRDTVNDLCTGLELEGRVFHNGKQNKGSRWKHVRYRES
jgi:hypothetical protein